VRMYRSNPLVKCFTSKDVSFATISPVAISDFVEYLRYVGEFFFLLRDRLHIGTFL